MAPKPNNAHVQGQDKFLATSTYSPAAATVQRLAARQVFFSPGGIWKAQGQDSRPGSGTLVEASRSCCDTTAAGPPAALIGSTKVAAAASRIVACMAAAGAAQQYHPYAMGLPFLPAIRSRQWDKDLQAMKEEILRRPETLGLAMLLIAAVAPMQTVAAATEAHLKAALGVMSLALFNTLTPDKRRSLLHRVPPLSTNYAPGAAKVAEPRSYRLSIDSVVSAPGSSSSSSSVRGASVPCSAASSVVNFVTVEEKEEAWVAGEEAMEEKEKIGEEEEPVRGAAEASAVLAPGLGEEAAVLERLMQAPPQVGSSPPKQPKEEKEEEEEAAAPHAGLVDEMSKQVMAMQEDLLSVMSEYERAEKELSEIMRDAKAAEGEIPVLDAEIKSLEAQLLSLKELREAQQQQQQQQLPVVDAAAVAVELRAAVTEEKGANRALGGFSQRDAIVGQIEALKRQLEEVVGEVEREQEELIEIREGVIRAEEELPVLDAEIEALEAERKLLLFKAKAEGREVVPETQRRLSSETVAGAALGIEFSAQEQEVCAREVEDLRRELEEVVGGIEAEREALVALVAEVEEVEMEVPALDAEIEALAAQKKFLAFRAQAAGGKEAEAAAVEGLRRAMEAEGLSGEEREAVKALSAGKLTEELRRDLAAVAAEVREEQLELVAMKEEAAEAERELPELDSEIEALETRLEALRAQKKGSSGEEEAVETEAAVAGGSGGASGRPVVVQMTSADEGGADGVLAEVSGRQEEAVREMAALRAELHQTESELNVEERELLALSAASAVVETELAGLEDEIQAVTDELLVVETECEAAKRELVALGGSVPPPIPTGKDVAEPLFKGEMMSASDRERVERRLGMLRGQYALPGMEVPAQAYVSAAGN